MKNYEFRLEKLLDIRRHKEEECKIKFQQAQSKKEEIKNRLMYLKDNYKKYMAVNSTESAILKKIKHQYLKSLSSNIENVTMELEHGKRVVEEIRADLKQKQIDRKVVETLKEKGRVAFMKEQNLIEQKANDEFALYGFIRRNEGR